MRSGQCEFELSGTDRAAFGRGHDSVVSSLVWIVGGPYTGMDEDTLEGVCGGDTTAYGGGWFGLDNWMGLQRSLVRAEAPRYSL